VDLKHWIARWQHDAEGNSRWIALNLEESRWWVATVVVAIAGVVMLLSRFAGVLLLLAGLVCFALAFAWDSVRWHWPLLPYGIENQINIGLALLTNPEFEITNLHDWQRQTRDLIAKIWSAQSRQARAFEAKGGYPVVKEPGFHRTILIEQIHVLQKLDPTLP
jgi:hypothetical protein